MHLNGALVKMYIYIPNVPVIPNRGSKSLSQFPD
jgi:hypothetical protein